MDIKLIDLRCIAWANDSYLRLVRRELDDYLEFCQMVNKEFRLSDFSEYFANYIKENGNK